MSVFGTEADLAASHHRYVNESCSSRSSSAGLEESGGESRAAADVVEFLGAKVIKEDVEGEDVFESGDCVAFGG